MNQFEKYQARQNAEKESALQTCDKHISGSEKQVKQ